MFTGLVQCMARVAQIAVAAPGKRITIEADESSREAALGDSIALNGCCLTLVENLDGRLVFEAGPETLSRTNLGKLAIGGLLNVEQSLRVGDRLGGHFVTGHVEGIGTLVAREDDRDWSTLWFAFPSELRRFMVRKGSIAVDGVSLTLVDVEAERFSVALIPHTLAVTTLGRLQIGDGANLETDLLAKYAQQAGDFAR